MSTLQQIIGRPLTYSEKILYSHLYDQPAPALIQSAAQSHARPDQPAPALIQPAAQSHARPEPQLSTPQNPQPITQQPYATFRPDRVAMQDATAQMAVLQFMTAGKDQVSVPASIHCDHLICAKEGVEKDLPAALNKNKEVYDFLQSAASRYGIDFWKPGSGIIHQIVLENYAFPGGMMVGTDSHTPNAGGLGMIAIGVGGADAVDVMTGMPWELKIPKIIGVRLTGELNAWASPKDVILKLAGILTVKGGTNAIIEYFGPGAKTISCTGKATICNMGAEVGATCSIFPYDETMYRYLCATARKDVADAAEAIKDQLQADEDVLQHPEQYYSQVIDIDLSSLEPYVNGPFTPDAACPLSQMPQRVAANNYPDKIEVCLIGSCTNSSYQDLAKAAEVAKSALAKGLKPKAELIVNPGSEQIKATAERDGILAVFRECGATIMTNACGPCIGQWERQNHGEPNRKNTIVTSFNRNFAKRADGNPGTHAFITSPSIAVALAFSGRFALPDIPAPQGEELPSKGFAPCDKGLCPPIPGSPEPSIDANSDRLQRLRPFPAWDGKDFTNLPLLIKVRGKCTTDHISMAGPWLRYRGHLENISRNLLLGAVDAFSGESGQTDENGTSLVSLRAKELGQSIIVAEDNYGEGSSREHAAMEPRYLGVRAIIAKSFARIHETNLKKQGILALTFATPADYDKILRNDSIIIHCTELSPGSTIPATITHSDGTQDQIVLNHSYNAQQIQWFQAGSALSRT